MFSDSYFEINIKLLMLILFYLLISTPIFLSVYNSSTNFIVDEEFHIGQAKEYCAGNFYAWNEKITTFPGLYMLAIILSPAELCTMFYLRFLVLSSSVVNVVFIYKILKFITSRNDNLVLWNTLSISILPPMYFFAHIFYTDVVSLTTILGLYYYWLNSRYKISACWGSAAVLMRQTNIIYVALVFGSSAIDEIIRDYKKIKNIQWNDTLMQLFDCVNFFIFNPVLLRKVLENIMVKFWMYIAIILAFIIFLVSNESIVVGDKSAHTASLHIPQLFYFSIYFLFFGFAIVLTKMKSCCRILWKNIKLVVIISLFFAVIVKHNTVVHPYLLADNRHYTFYLWKNFYAKYSWFRYIIIPAYVFGLSIITTTLNKSQKLSFKIMYYISTFIVLCLQSLIEIRYFIIPFLLIRLNIVINNKYLILLELFSYIIINLTVVYIFCTKEIRWENYKDIQRLMW